MHGLSDRKNKVKIGIDGLNLIRSYIYQNKYAKVQ